ncbi:MAG: hypothetical protein KIT73_19250 [Burkholderiales bacterium]|nr:hypothetical protein [Burkholderiales bacterium]
MKNKCFFCNDLAEVSKGGSFGRWVTMRCPTCGSYVASRRATKLMLKLDADGVAQYKRMVTAANQELIAQFTVRPGPDGDLLKFDLIPRRGASI